jgi:hypothetical protein
MIMSDRDAWIHFYCAIRSKEHVSDSDACRYADNALDALRKRDKEKLFDQFEGGYRGSSEINFSFKS